MSCQENQLVPILGHSYQSQITQVADYDAVSDGSASFVAYGVGTYGAIDVAYNDRLPSLAERLGGGSFSLQLSRRATDQLFIETIAAVRGYADRLGQFKIYDSHGSDRIEIGRGLVTGAETVMDFTPREGPRFLLRVSNTSLTADTVQKTIDFKAIAPGGRDYYLRQPAPRGGGFAQPNDSPFSVTNGNFSFLGIRSTSFDLKRVTMPFDNDKSRSCSLSPDSCGLPSYSPEIPPLSSGKQLTYYSDSGTISVDLYAGLARGEVARDVEVTYEITDAGNDNLNFTLNFSREGNSETISVAVRDHPESTDLVLVYDRDEVIGRGTVIESHIYQLNFNHENLSIYLLISTRPTRSSSADELEVAMTITDKTGVDHVERPFTWLGLNADWKITLHGRMIGGEPRSLWLMPSLP